MSSDDPFAISYVDAFEIVGRVAKALFNGMEALFEDLRYARENINVVNVDNLGERRLGRQQRGALGNVGHAQPGFVHVAAQPLAHASFEVWVTHYFETKAVSDSFD